MRNKKRQDIYIRQHQGPGRKPSPVSKPFIITVAVIFVLAIGSLAYFYRDMWMKKQELPVPVIRKETITLYIPSGQNKLIEKKIDMTGSFSDKAKGDLIIKKLKELKIIPEEVVLNDIAVDYESTLYLNFSNIVSEKPMSAMAEILKTFSIVNSFLGTFKNTNKVQLLADGQPVYTLNGAVYVYKPLEFNKDLLED